LNDRTAAARGNRAFDVLALLLRGLSLSNVLGFGGAARCAGVIAAGGLSAGGHDHAV
jgi:hypothetical protein